LRRTCRDNPCHGQERKQREHPEGQQQDQALAILARSSMAVSYRVVHDKFSSLASLELESGVCFGSVVISNQA
jgi:hypothetical protein